MGRKIFKNYSRGKDAGSLKMSFKLNNHQNLTRALMLDEKASENSTTACL